MAAWDYEQTKQRGSIGTRLWDERDDSGWVSTQFDVDTATGKGRVVELGTPYTFQWLVDPDGTPRARAEWVADTKEYTVLARDARGWRPVHRKTGLDWMAPAGTAADGKALVVVGENGTDRSRAWSLPLDGGPPSVLFEDPAQDVSAVLADDLTGTVVGFEIGGLDAPALDRSAACPAAADAGEGLPGARRGRCAAIRRRRARGGRGRSARAPARALPRGLRHRSRRHAR